MRGVVPACRSLDAMSIFALTAEDAARVRTRRGEVRRGRCLVAQPRTRAARAASAARRRSVSPCRAPAQLEFFGNAAYAQLFDASRRSGCAVSAAKPSKSTSTPLLEAARLLYEGPWVAERYLATESLLDSHPEAMLDVTRRIISGRRAARRRSTPFARSTG